MRLTEAQLRRVIRKELMREFFGMFGGDPEWLKANGEINLAKLSPEQKEIYSAARGAGDTGKDLKAAKKAVEALGFRAADLSKEDQILIRKSWSKGNVSFTSGDYHGI